eukprot:gene19635-26835_t
MVLAVGLDILRRRYFTVGAGARSAKKTTTNGSEVSRRHDAGDLGRGKMTTRTGLKRRLTQTVLGAAALAASFGSVSMAQAADIHLLWVQAMKDHPVHRLMQAGFLDKCKELGYTCEVVGDPSATNWDIPATLPLAEAAIARTKYDAIGVYGPDP